MQELLKPIRTDQIFKGYVGSLTPNPAKPVGAKRKSRFIGEMNIEY
jgi:hypothetical protein